MSLGTSLRHFFIPHETNNHRAKALQIDSLLVYVLLFALFNLGIRGAHKVVPDVLGYATDINVQQLLADTNAKRQAEGLSPLTLNSTLSVAAANKAADMFTNNYWAHNSPTGATPWEFITGAGYHYTVAGENLAKNFSDSQGVIDAWMASSSHRENLLKSNYRDVGFAVVNGTLNGEETTLVVQMFGATSGELAAAAPTQPPQPARLPASPNRGEPARPVVIPAEAATANVPAPTIQPVQPAHQPAVSGFESVNIQPLFNIPTVSHDLVFAFVGILMGVLFVDAWIASRRRVVRIAGHNIAHILFLSALFILMSGVSRGRLL
jgi:uncharacterized protein YkwD